MLTTAHEPRIRAQALNHVSPWFADVVWRGLSTRHVRAGLDGHIDLERLRHLWRPISPFSYLDRVRQTRDAARLRALRPDVPGRPVADARSTSSGDAALPHEAAVLPCGHYSTGSAPFKFLDGYRADAVPAAEAVTSGLAEVGRSTTALRGNREQPGERVVDDFGRAGGRAARSRRPRPRWPR